MQMFDRCPECMSFASSRYLRTCLAGTSGTKEPSQECQRNGQDYVGISFVIGACWCRQARPGPRRVWQFRLTIPPRLLVRQ